VRFFEIKWSSKMKNLITICLIPLIISCVSKPTPDLPDHWEYSPGKYVGFKETVELAWDYDESEIDKFEIDREKLKLKDDDFKEIIKLIKEKKNDGLVEKEKILRENIKYDQKVTIYRPSDQRSYKDKEEPLPTFGDICFYQVRAWKNGIPSPYAELSIILVHKLK
jgi:hypothetical protein